MSSTVVDFNKAKIVQRDQVIFEAIDLKIAKGEFVYLIGKTGSGKSSLLKTLYGELPLNSGTGQVAGFNLLGLKERHIPSLRRKLGLFFKIFNYSTTETSTKICGLCSRQPDGHKRPKLASALKKY